MTDPTPAQAVLVIEDDAAMRRFLLTTLGAQGYRVHEAATAQEGIAGAARHCPALVLLDLGLPDHDGLTVLGRLREWSNLPVIVLSARDREDAKIAALDAGADDYLTKPFGTGELLARIRAVLRSRSQAEGRAQEVFRSGDLRVDLLRRQVFVGASEIHLTPNEYTILETLVRHAGRVVTHRQLLGSLLGPNPVSDPSYLRVYMGSLRQKIEAEPARPRYLITEPGVGYRLREEDSDLSSTAPRKSAGT